MGRMVTTENIISLIQTIPISVHKGQHALLLADNSAESIALYGFFLKNNVPLILLNASMRDEQVQEYMDEYLTTVVCVSEEPESATIFRWTERVFRKQKEVSML